MLPWLIEFHNNKSVRIKGHPSCVLSIANSTACMYSLKNHSCGPENPLPGKEAGGQEREHSLTGIATLKPQKPCQVAASSVSEPLLFRCSWGVWFPFAEGPGLESAAALATVLDGCCPLQLTQLKRLYSWLRPCIGEKHVRITAKLVHSIPTLSYPSAVPCVPLVPLVPNKEWGSVTPLILDPQ